MQQAKRVYDANTSLFTVLQDWAVASIQLSIYYRLSIHPDALICLQLLRQLCAMHAGFPIAKIVRHARRFPDRKNWTRVARY